MYFVSDYFNNATVGIAQNAIVQYFIMMLFLICHLVLEYQDGDA